MGRMLALCLAVVASQAWAAELPAPKAQPRLENAPLRPRPRLAVKPRFKQRRIGQAPGPDTPLAVNFESSTDVALVRGGVPFEFEPGVSSDSAWPKTAAWLVTDLNRNGQIDSGRELFGSFTWLGARLAAHGFEALAALDHNGDQVIDGAELEPLRLWSDRNSNRRVDDGELETLAARGVTRLPTRFNERRACIDDCVREWAPISFRDADGREQQGRLVDLHLRLTPRQALRAF